MKRLLLFLSVALSVFLFFLPDSGAWSAYKCFVTRSIWPDAPFALLPDAKNDAWNYRYNLTSCSVTDPINSGTLNIWYYYDSASSIFSTIWLKNATTSDFANMNLQGWYTSVGGGTCYVYVYTGATTVSGVWVASISCPYSSLLTQSQVNTLALNTPWATWATWATWPAGANGTNGTNGRGITSITLISGTHAPWTLDTYKILYTDSSSGTYQVYNWSWGTVWATWATGKWIVWLSLASWSHLPWQTDIYQLSYTDGTSQFISVYNGYNWGTGATGATGSTVITFTGITNVLNLTGMTLSWAFTATMQEQSWAMDGSGAYIPMVVRKDGTYYLDWVGVRNFVFLLLVLLWFIFILWKKFTKNWSGLV